MTVQERLLKFIETTGLNVSQFEKSCGMTNSTVNNMRKSIGEMNLKKIQKKYPELNKVWLLFGEGDMVAGQPEKQSDYRDKYIAVLEEKVQLLEKKIQELESAQHGRQSSG